ncbi:head-tail joining protein [Klebsiella aerogenes]|uniref:head-tail joining protein n=1 Tax=Klebsiella aerogenes TaxID=548 RepID=UPI00186842B0|nr:hypothetical protein [Klebsiella aerogenes]HBW1044598.1 hypothetical protein [Klebsiella pneumoniae]HDU5774989.1 hypothetical protein [Klebsiella variicola]EKT3979631.1 hypothetical protein [Klebsiella aerogenes]HBW7417054.1 hypothetical protein [Klebsiella pneumoniae]HBW7526788.1 hypothetical protein [Klebsiella pneumoniae]
MSRAFNNNQIDSFLNAFGETINVDGISVPSIVEMRNIEIETGDGFIAVDEHWFTCRKSDVPDIDMGSTVIIRGQTLSVFDIIDDLSGIIDVTARRK